MFVLRPNLTVSVCLKASLVIKALGTTYCGLRALHSACKHLFRFCSLHIYITYTPAGHIMCSRCEMKIVKVVLTLRWTCQGVVLGNYMHLIHSILLYYRTTYSHKEKFPQFTRPDRLIEKNPCRNAT